MREIACYSASLVIGLSLGLIGAGGSILTIPAFVYIVRTDPVSASIYSMFVVGLSSLIGSVKAYIKNLLDWQTALLFGIPSATGVLISRRIIFPGIPDVIFSDRNFTLSKTTLLMTMLAVVMIIASLKMLKSGMPVTINKSERHTMRTRPLLLQGLLTGILTGLLGIGGGFLVIPALIFWARVPMKKAIGTGLLIIAINACFGFLNSYSTISMDWILLFRFSAGATIGVLIGTKLSEKIPGDHLKKIFGLFILLVSFFIIYQVFGAVRPYHN